MHIRAFPWLIIAAAFALSACDNPETRAAQHLERGTSFAAEGDTERAVIEFRNALQAVNLHLPTLRAYAELMRSTGKTHESIAIYSQLVSLDAADVEIHIALAELSMGSLDLAAVEEHTELALDLAPDDPRVRALKASVVFKRGQTEEAVDIATAVLEELPESLPAHMVLVAARLAAGDPVNALQNVDAALSHLPASEELHLMRLATLEEIGDANEVGKQLQQMAELFPEDDAIRQVQLQWYLHQGDHESALAHLRREAENHGDAVGGSLHVAQFLLRTRGPDAARAELERLIATMPEALPYHRALAQLDFAEGRSGEAAAALEALTQDAEPSPEVRDLQISLAEIYRAIRRGEEAAALVDEVLEADPRHVEALKMRARHLIEADDTERALADLRAAAIESPRDPDIMTLMAMAHEREGARQLVGERLSRAVEASSFAPAETMRYARFLLQEGRAAQAEGVVLDGLQRSRDNLELLDMLGRIHLQRGDFTQARQVAGTLRDLNEETAVSRAVALEASVLQAEGRMGDVAAILESMGAEAGDDLSARVASFQARLISGDFAGAEAEAVAILAEDPANITGRMLQAGLHVVNGRPQDAEMIYRSVIDESPELQVAYQALFILLNSLERTEDAATVLEEGLAATRRDASLLGLLAARRYIDADYDAAIDLYNELYLLDTSNMAVANNLASLLSVHRADAESHEKAFNVGRRLRGTEVPHFQDTYGWILVLRGDAEQALRYLEPAATALSEEPLVQYHLGRAYFALERWQEAEASFGRVVELAELRGSDLPQIESAREHLAELKRDLDG
jgi:cellulose synthase operon protein C